MSAIGYRQKGQDGPLYNPERDFAYITPTLMARAVANMECGYDNDDETRKWCDDHGITKADMAKVAEALALAQRDFVNSADPVNSFEHALLRRDFFFFSAALRQYLFAAIGETVCAAWFTAVREVSVVGEESPAQSNMARFSAAVAEFVARTGCGMPEPDTAVEILKYRNAVLQTRLNVVYQELQSVKDKLAAATVAQPVDVCPSTKFDFMPGGGMFGWLARLFSAPRKKAGTKKCQNTGCIKTRRSSGLS